MPGSKRPRSPCPPQPPPPPLPASTAVADGGVRDGAAAARPEQQQHQKHQHQRQRRPKPKPRPLKVHIVEDHGDVLEHLYDAIGAKRVPFRGLRWVHLDSHPDLTLPPDLRPETVMDPPALYAALEASPGGNAEFILPAVFAGHVHEVWWVRPPWADQLPDGDSTFDVGVEAASGCLRVASPELYYLDEGLYCPNDALDSTSSRNLRLNVCTAEAVIDAAPNDHDRTAHKAAEASEGWILDVCLDYYTTRNPFLDALEDALRAQGGWDEPGIAGARATVRGYFDGPRSRWDGRESPVAQVQEEMATFKRLTAQLLDRALDVASTSPSPPPLLSATEAATLHSLFTPNHKGQIQAFTTLLLKGGRPVIDSIRAMDGHCACLPAHAGGWAEVEGMLGRTGALARRLCRDFGGPPALVLVARSARDGYTPVGMVDRIQERLLAVLEAIPELTAAGGGEGLRVLRHYEDEEEVEEEEGMENEIA